MSTIKADRKEVLRYLGYKHGATPDEEISARINACEKALSEVIEPRSVQKILPLEIEESLLRIGPAEVTSSALAKHLAGCSRVMLFAATLGIGPDRLIQRAQVTRISDAVLYQAISAAMIEAYCNELDCAFAASVEAEGGSTRSRFSPGYGDLPLDFQKDVFRILDTPKAIGLTLTDALLMMPSKSVTAIIGIGDQPADKADRKEHKCETCPMTDCPYRDAD